MDIEKLGGGADFQETFVLIWSVKGVGGADLPIQGKLSHFRSASLLSCFMGMVYLDEQVHVPTSALEVCKTWVGQQSVTWTNDRVPNLVSAFKLSSFRVTQKCMGQKRLLDKFALVRNHVPARSRYFPKLLNTKIDFKKPQPIPEDLLVFRDRTLPDCFSLLLCIRVEIVWWYTVHMKVSSEVSLLTKESPVSFWNCSLFNHGEKFFVHHVHSCDWPKVFNHAEKFFVQRVHSCDWPKVGCDHRHLEIAWHRNFVSTLTSRAVEIFCESDYSSNWSASQVKRGNLFTITIELQWKSCKLLEGLCFCVVLSETDQWLNVCVQCGDITNRLVSQERLSLGAGTSVFIMYRHAIWWVVLTFGTSVLHHTPPLLGGAGINRQFLIFWTILQ